jgi:hypothetical protein
MVNETENERLDAIERKILQKYGATSASSRNPNLSSPCFEEDSTLGVHSAPNLHVESNKYLPSAEEQSASSKISICSHCAGVGKIYERMAVGGPEGICRVLESCCTVCDGMCYITNGEVRLGKTVKKNCQHSNSLFCRTRVQTNPRQKPQNGQSLPLYFFDTTCANILTFKIQRSGLRR